MVASLTRNYGETPGSVLTRNYGETPGSVLTRNYGETPGSAAISAVAKYLEVAAEVQTWINENAEATR